MKQTFFTLLLCTGLIYTLLSCKKNDESTNSNGFAGSYRGIVSDTINGSFFASLNDYTLILNPTNTTGQVTLTNNLIITNTATISGNVFSIPLMVATQTSLFKTEEHAEGVFTGSNNNTLKVIFYQDQINLSTGAYQSRMKRACVLVKQ